MLTQCAGQTMSSTVKSLISIPDADERVGQWHREERLTQAGPHSGADGSSPMRLCFVLWPQAKYYLWFVEESSVQLIALLQSHFLTH